MQIRKKIVTLLPAIALLWGSQCFATGMGATLGQIDEDWAFSADRDVTNIGFVLDTNVARNRVFNYRFSFTSEENTAGASSFEGFAMTHDFGFGVVMLPAVRVWIGPRLNFARYDDNNTSQTIAGLLFGFVAGVNVNLPGNVSLSFTTGKLSGEYTASGGNCFLLCDEDVDSTFFNASVIFRLGRDRY